MGSLDALRAFRPMDAARKPYLPPLPHKVAKARDFLPVLGTGAVGDLVITLGVVEIISRRVPVRFWCPYPEFASWIAGTHWEGGPTVFESGPYPGFDHQVVLNSLARFDFHPTRFKRFWSAPVAEMYEHWKRYERASPWAQILACHPRLDYMAGEVSGLTRAQLPYAMLGLEPQIKRIVPQVGKYDFEPFITVHDGVDASQRGIARPTKTWHLKKWGKFVELFKARHPGISVVQLGGPVSRPIQGVDVQLTGRTTVPEAFKVLSRSRLHVDGESGLVHAAASMGVQSVVMFGPTPASFFGYGSNAVVSAGDCHGCWWLRDDWLDRCPRSLESPKCMDAIEPEAVLSAVESRLQ